MTAFTRYAKGWIAALGAGLASLYQALDGGDGIGKVTTKEWVAVLIAVVAVGGATAGIPNTPGRKARRADMSEKANDAGYATSGGLLAALIVILVLIVFFTGAVHSPLIFLLLLVALLVLFL